MSPSIDLTTCLWHIYVQCDLHENRCWPEGRFRITYELLNLRALTILPVHKTYIFQCMVKDIYPYIEDMIFIQHWYFKSRKFVFDGIFDRLKPTLFCWILRWLTGHIRSQVQIENRSKKLKWSRRDILRNKSLLFILFSCLECQTETTGLLCAAISACNS